MSLANDLSLIPTLPAGAVGTVYKVRPVLSAPTDRTLIFTTDVNTLPPGISLDVLTGVLYGTPTKDGIYTLSYNVTNGIEQKVVTYTFIVNTVISITASFYSVLAGKSFSLKPVLAGGLGQQTWSITGVLPNGLKQNPSTGEIYGITTQVGKYPITITVTDLTGTSSASGSLQVVDVGTNLAIPETNQDAQIDLRIERWKLIANRYATASPEDKQACLNDMVTITNAIITMPTQHALDAMWSLHLLYKDTLFSEGTFFGFAASLTPSMYAVISAVYSAYRNAVAYPSVPPRLDTLVRTTKCPAMAIYLKRKYQV